MNKLEKPPEQVLHFFIQETLACVDLHSINQTILLPMLETVPGSPIYIAGLLNFGGKSIPIIDLALRLKIPRLSSYSLDTPILLCTDSSNQCGIIVDKIVGLAALQPENYQMQKEFKANKSDFLGTINYDSRLSLLINIQKILGDSFTMGSIGKILTVEES